MSSISDLLTSFGDIEENFDCLDYDIQPYILNYLKMNIFNKKIKRPLQKIWIRSPELKIWGNFHIIQTKKTFALLKVILYENDDEIKKFKEFIDMIEKYISITIDKHYPNLKLQSCIKEQDFLSPILIFKIPFVKNKDSFYFDIYDQNNNIISYDTIESGSNAKFYL